MRRWYKILFYITIFVATFASLNQLFEVSLAIGEKGMDYISSSIVSPRGFDKWTMIIVQLFQAILVTQEIKRLSVWGVFSSRDALLLQMWRRLSVIYVTDIALRSLAVVWTFARWAYLGIDNPGYLFFRYNMSIGRDTAIMTAAVLTVWLYIKNREIL